MDNIKSATETGWSLSEVIEAIARSLEIKDFKVDVRKSVERIAYDPESKTMLIKGEFEDCISVKTLAHELYHHYQNMIGTLPQQDSREKREYTAFRYKLNIQYDPNFSWMYLTFPWEAQAEMFSRVFIERHYHYLHKIGILTDDNLARELEEASEIGVPKKLLPRHLKYAEQFKIDIQKVYKAIYAKYVDKIDSTLEVTLGKRDDWQEYSFEIIGSEGND